MKKLRTGYFDAQDLFPEHNLATISLICGGLGGSRIDINGKQLHFDAL